MRYVVEYVADDRLPAAQDWALVRVGEEITVLFVKESRVSARLIEEAWAAFRSLDDRRRLSADGS